MKLGAILGAGALVAVALVAGSALKGGGGGGTATLSIDGQPFFNTLPASEQQDILAKLYSWYVNTKGTGTWPGYIGDPQLTSQSDLTAPDAFQLTVEAFAVATNTTTETSGTLNLAVAQRLGAQA